MRPLCGIDLPVIAVVTPAFCTALKLALERRLPGVFPAVSTSAASLLKSFLVADRLLFSVTSCELWLFSALP
ncbi:hypothetical protein CRN65_27255 (plasmid) [Klebsiella pneumoniae]|nr:hypothetical protein CRN65_27255 [Klebsiella pneumoniae]